MSRQRFNLYERANSIIRQDGLDPESLSNGERFAVVIKRIWDKRLPPSILPLKSIKDRVCANCAKPGPKTVIAGFRVWLCNSACANEFERKQQQKCQELKEQMAELRALQEARKLLAAVRKLLKNPDAKR